MPSVIWKDGTVSEGSSWGAVLKAVNAMGWNEHLSVAELREDLAKRAMIWANVEVDPDLPAKEFFEALAKAGVLEIQ